MNKKTLFIYQNAFSQTGGIQAFNKYFISALEDIKNENENFDAELLSIYDNKKDIKSILKFTTLNNSKLSAFKHIFKYQRSYDTFIFAHVNLAPLAIFLKILKPNANILFCTHGIEIWKKLSKSTEWIMNKSTVLTVSNFSKNELLKYNPNLKDIRLFPNCIKMQDTSKILNNPYNENEFNILSVTRLSSSEKLKGIDTMIKTLPDTCTVRMDGNLHESQDFVTILSKENGDASIFYNTDALTLGMAMKMVAKEFVTCVSNCTLAEQQEIQAILGDAFILERLREEE